MKMSPDLFRWIDNDGHDVTAPPDAADHFEIASKMLGPSGRVEMLTIGGGRWRVATADSVRADVGSGPYPPPQDRRRELAHALAAAGLPVDEE